MIGEAKRVVAELTPAEYDVRVIAVTLDPCTTVACSPASQHELATPPGIW